MQNYGFLSANMYRNYGGAVWLLGEGEEKCLIFQRDRGLKGQIIYWYNFCL